MSRHLGRAHIIYFSELERWTPLRNAIEQGNEAASWSPVTIGDLVTPIESRVIVQPDAEYRMAGVKWYGEGVFHRETVLGCDMSAKYVTPLKTRALIYNRLFAWKESFAVVQPEHEGLYVSNEFPQFEIDTSKALPEFIYLFCTIPATIKQVSAASAGSAAISRNRFKEAEFLRFNLRLPPLSTQQAIVEHAQKAVNATRAIKEHQAQLSAELNQWLLEQTDQQAFKASSVVVGWSGLETWNVQNARAAIFKQTNPAFVPFSTYAEEATVSVRPADKPDHEWPVYGVNNQDGVFFSHLQKGSEFNSPYKRIQADWFFHNPTRSAVGSLGLVPSVPEDAITSPEYQVWKLRDLGNDSLQSGFVATLIQTPWFVKVIQFHRVGTVKQRLYLENLLAIPVPRFPKKLQQRVADERARIAAERAAAAKLAADTAREVEEMILGHRPVPDIT